MEAYASPREASRRIEAAPQKRESYLHSQRAPVVSSDQNVVAYDPTGKGKLSKEQSRTATKEPKKRRVQSPHLL
ncbi:hypothetical protein MA16_Dca024943 [Dendrobium catenatum]|uniref:Uncharacterized protein n=1 Tax=Dendrobium catenatum TaxID=906689 RepID=A0A2I0VJ53_9ASPA|nr:hypothetical protein MA16_Dca024943 [Dendrobium catenatum]